MDRKYIANYASLQVRERLLRMPGVGDVGVNAARDYAMRVWIDPDKAAARDLTVQEIVDALRNNNLQVAGGAVGAPPFNEQSRRVAAQHPRAGKLLDRRTSSRDAIIKRDARRARHAHRRISARVELGAQNYGINAYKNREPAVALSVNQAPGTNALEVADNSPAHDGGAEGAISRRASPTRSSTTRALHPRRRSRRCSARCSTP